MVFTTTHSIEGERIAKYKKIISEAAAAGGRLGCAPGEEPVSVNSLTEEEFHKLYVDTQKKAFDRLVAEAERLKANAVIGVTTDHSFTGPDDETLLVTVTGTAVMVDVSYY